MQAERHARPSVGGRPGVGNDPMIGRVLDGRYRIASKIARGGMATVYEAHDERLDRTVAVKVMHAGLGDSADDQVFAQRFVGEARAAARLAHPNVVAVYDQGSDQGTLFLAMELVRGETLRDVIAREAPLRPAVALAYLEPVLAALAAAHRAGLVHRDVKPENVLIAAPSGGRDPAAHRVKVADFGLARAVTAQTQHTSSGVIIGTVSYIAPELVVEGRSDARADVYSAGVMLYELLTGAKPHAGESPIQVAYKHVHEDVPPPSRAVPGLPAYVDALVARATARDRSLRPADAGVFLQQARMVARALADGVRDDPELVADLALPAFPAVAIVGTEGITAVDGDEATAVLRSGTDPTARITPPLTGGDTARTRRAPGGPAGPAVPGGPSGRAGARRPRRPRRRRWPAALAALILLAAAGTAVAVERDHIPLLDGVTVPGVTGMTPAVASDHLQEAGLVVAGRESAYSNTVASGEVVNTDPGMGARLHHGDTVELVVSKGIEQYPVPRLAGKTLAQSTTALHRIKMDVVAKHAWSQAVAKGLVIRTSPRAGVVLRPGADVTVVVSKGPKPVTVADWSGEPAVRATQTLHQQGLGVDTRYVYDDHMAKGLVIRESPSSSHVFHRGDTITLTVSKGPHLVMVPTGLAGHSEDTVTHDLQAAGFHVRVEHFYPYFGIGLVMQVDDSGQMLPYGSTVVIHIS